MRVGWLMLMLVGCEFEQDGGGFRNTFEPPELPVHDRFEEGFAHARGHEEPFLCAGGTIRCGTARPEPARALSGAGFVQYRLDLDAAAVVGQLTLRGGALGRVRTQAEEGSLQQTAGIHLGADYRLWRSLELTATTGLLSAQLVEGGGFVDVFGWAGLRWRFARNEK